ncbi:MAG: Na+/H+ antiporter subunit G [Tistlia sp.]|uniref:Na+/H+ antiporter subunit G n=1 Tax=Tistlia sp. TaxID=3057121 RepID=UPI0034A12C14
MESFPLDVLAELLVVLLIVIAGVFGLVGSYGLAKLPDLMTRLHAPTKATTLGVGGALLASMVYFLSSGTFTLHELLITLFLLLTAPITAHMVAKAYLHAHGAQELLPPTGRKYGWASFDAAPPSGGDALDSIEAPRLAED